MSRPSVVVLDYGSGNLRSAERALLRAGGEVTVTSDFDAALNADGLVVPGVGAFAACMAGINAVQGANVVFNASLGYQMNSSTDVFANGVNVFNRQYQDGAYTATAPQTQTLSVPRMISVGFRHRF